MKLQLLIIALFIYESLAQGSCGVPPPSANFTVESYLGVWYEIGKIQTFGGGFFEEGCVCTSLIVTPGQGEIDAYVNNTCHRYTPNGEFVSAYGELFDQNPPGRFKESFYWFEPDVSYNVIFIDKYGESFAVEYDCSDVFGIVNYCIHILARTPTMDKDLFYTLVEDSVALGLNTQNISLKITQQDGCW